MKSVNKSLTNTGTTATFTLPKYTELLNVAPNTVLPTALNPKDKCQFLELSKQSLRVSYQGTGKSDSDAAAVRSNFSIPQSMGVYYYEVTIVSKGRDGYIGIGLCASSVSLQRLPGWEPNSWGYHGDDGHSFNSNGSGRQYGPSFTTGDVIGCGVNFHTKSCFFTKNGLFLGYAFTGLSFEKIDLYVAVGLRTPHEVLELNFGATPFMFNIQDYVADEIDALDASISNVPVGSGNVCAQLLLRHLLYAGYMQTAIQFSQDVNISLEPQLIVRCRLKLEIWSFIKVGNYDELFSLLKREFTIPQNDLLLFGVKCMKFVDLVKSIYAQSPSQPSPMKQSGHERSWPTKAAPTDEFEMLKAALDYGQNLQLEYGADERLFVQQKLIEIFSLLAYPDPLTCPSMHLFENARKVEFFDNLNMRLFGKEEQGGGDDVLGNAIGQLDCVVGEMGLLGCGSSGLIRTFDSLIEG